MGRPYAKLYRDIWTDPDLRALGRDARYVYIFLFSQPDLNAAGVLPLTVRRWAGTAGMTPEEMTGTLALLNDHRYVVIDDATEELLIRTYIRNDELWRIPNTLYAVVRDAARTVSPTLRATLAAELAALPVDNLTGKRAADMKVQLTTVTATLSRTVDPTVGPTTGVRVRVRDAGEGGSSVSSNGYVDNQSSGGYARAREGAGDDDDRLIDLIISELLKATGKNVDRQWAAKTRDYILENRTVTDPAAYVRQVIRNDPDPRTRFLPVY